MPRLAVHEDETSLCAHVAGARRPPRWLSQRMGFPGRAALSHSFRETGRDRVVQDLEPRVPWGRRWLR
jgi:hypothetical protein